MKIFVIPDVQAKPGINFNYLERVGMYIQEKQPDHVVMIGDFADMASLSSYDKGKKSFEGRRYIKDVGASKKAMDILMDSMLGRGLSAKLHLTLGNHENRINRAVENQPELAGLISVKDLDYETYGWSVYPFLDTVTIGGVVFSHYFTSGPMGRPVSSAQRLITTKHQSCVAGHMQGRQVAYGFRADGKQLTSIIAGSCYEHNEDYMGPQGNRHWRGIVCLHEVNNGSFDEMFVSLNYLKQRYKGK